MQEHKLFREEWEERITNGYGERWGMLWEDAKMEYLKLTILRSRIRKEPSCGLV
jgi:hypothetical protein